MFDRQEYFNRGVRGIREQGGPATDGYVCQYRAPNGAKCFHGHNIPDENYNKDLEGMPVAWVPHNTTSKRHLLALAAGIDNNDDANFAKECQGAHDEAYSYGEEYAPANFMDVFLNKARNVAAKYNIDASVCD